MAKLNGLIFGASGSIGSFLMEKFEEKHSIIGTSSSESKLNENIIFVSNDNYENLLNINNLDFIIWAHGHNFNDNINTFNADNFCEIINANVKFILNSLHYLLDNNKIKNGAKLVIISSIWEEFTRNDKLSYSISKSALSGLVKNVSYDLAKKNILINNILPGVIENEMTKKTLNAEQINYIKNYLPFQRMISLDDIYNTVNFFAINNSGITGQSIKVDLGFTNIKKYE